MKKDKNLSELVVLKEHKAIINNFLVQQNIEYETEEETEETIKIYLKLQSFSRQKAFNLGIKLQRYISEYTKIDFPKAE